LKDEKSIKQARKRLRKQLKDEKKYNKQLGKLIDQYIKTLNAKNSTNYSLNKI
jgi:phosphotransferase system IIB component